MTLILGAVMLAVLLAGIALVVYAVAAAPTASDSQSAGADPSAS